MSDAGHKPVVSLGVLNTSSKLEELRRMPVSTRPAQPSPEAADAPARTPEQHALVERIIAALRTVYDPEIPVNIHDLGLVYAIEPGSAGQVAITMTLTAPGCPVADAILREVQSKVVAVEGVSSVDVRLVFDPPWTKDRMSESALLELGLL